MSKIRQANFYERVVARNKIDDYGLYIEDLDGGRETIFENTAAGRPAKTHLTAV